MTDESSHQDVAKEEEKSFLQVIVHSFFIIPFLIAVFCLLLFGSVNLLTREKRTAYDYLEDVKTGGQNKRWQGAFELSKILATKKVNEDTRFTGELIDAFEHSIHDDVRVRQYLALAMGRTQNPAYRTVLENALSDKEENLPTIIYALGMLGQKESSQSLHPFLKHDNARIRSIATVALGNIANSDSIPQLRKALEDTEPNVRWGSAISLAEMGQNQGRDIILKLINRSYYDQFKEIDPEEKKNLMITAINASGKILDDEIKTSIQTLAKADPNMKVRSAAMKILENE